MKDYWLHMVMFNIVILNFLMWNTTYAGELTLGDLFNRRFNIAY
jgi:hypothetical protein